MRVIVWGNVVAPSCTRDGTGLLARSLTAGIADSASTYEFITSDDFQNTCNHLNMAGSVLYIFDALAYLVDWWILKVDEDLQAEDVLQDDDSSLSGERQMRSLQESLLDGSSSENVVLVANALGVREATSISMSNDEPLPKLPLFVPEFLDTMDYYFWGCVYHAFDSITVAHWSCFAGTLASWRDRFAT